MVRKSSSSLQESIKGGFLSTRTQSCSGFLNSFLKIVYANMCEHEEIDSIIKAHYK